jgi:hypothetical protein
MHHLAMLFPPGPSVLVEDVNGDWALLLLWEGGAHRRILYFREAGFALTLQQIISSYAVAMFVHSTARDPAEISAYHNALPRFSEQIHEVDADVLTHAGKIFVQHRMHENFGLTLLHRHHDVPDGWVMVHQTSFDADLCVMEPAARSELHSQTWSLNPDGLFVPIDFSTQPCLMPSLGFAADFKAMICSHGLVSVLGFTNLRKSQGTWVERDLPYGTIAVRNEEASTDCNTIPTTWAFAYEKEQLKIRVVQSCEKDQSSGVHKVV